VFNSRRDRLVDAEIMLRLEMILVRLDHIEIQLRRPVTVPIVHSSPQGTLHLLPVDRTPKKEDGGFRCPPTSTFEDPNPEGAA
jgi:hypothetical protein